MEQSLDRRATRPGPARETLSFAEKLWRLLRETAAKWSATKAPRLGAALAYYTVFSLAPLLIIAILIAGAIFGQAAAQQQIMAQIGAVMGPQGAAGVAALLGQKNIPGQSLTLTTIISIVTLILGAIGVFGQLQDAFDTVWDVTPPPTKGVTGFVRRRLMPFGMVLAVAFLLLVATVLNAALAGLSSHIGPTIPYFNTVNTIINVVLPLVVTTLLFAALFKYVPDVHLAWRDLWVGAFLTAVLFTVGKIAIGLYLGYSSLGNASGAAGSLLVVLVWVYYTAQIVLFGAVFTQVFIHYHGQAPQLVDPAQTSARAVAAQKAANTQDAAVTPAAPEQTP